MEGTSGGIFGRLFEKTIGWIILGVLIALGIAIYQMGPTGRDAVWNGIWRTVAWIVMAGAVPWSARLFIRRVLEMSTNWAGLAVLASFTIVDAGVGLALLGGWPSGGWGWVAALAALGAAGTYNFLVTEYLSEEFGV